MPVGMLICGFSRMFSGTALCGFWEADKSGMGAGLMPAGEAMEVGTRKSSRFMGSAFCSAERSIDLRSCAMPLGAEVGAFAAWLFLALSTGSY